MKTITLISYQYSKAGYIGSLKENQSLSLDLDISKYEAKLKKVKTIAISDTDANPYKVDLAIVANDDSTKSVNLIMEEIGRAIKAAGTK